MMKAEIVFIPTPGISHLVSTVEVAKLLVDRDERLSFTFLIMKLGIDSNIDSYIESVSATSNGIRFIDLPKDVPDPSQPNKPLFSVIEAQKPRVREEVSKIVSQSEFGLDSPRLAAFVLDMFCTPMIDVANEFEVPSYLFFTSGAAFLGLEFYFLHLHDEQQIDPTEFKDSDAELEVPCLANPLPTKFLPSVMLNKEWLPAVLRQIRRFRETKGIVVNTFEELESYTINYFSNGDNPPVYPVGPILNLGGDGHDAESNAFKDIKQWLDDQPPSSVVFLCFGSRGSFGAEQVKDIAYGLEQSGHRFLWSVRRPPPDGKYMEAPSDYENLEEVLPEGFLDRTANVGKVIGWAPQKDILAHPSIGGFVSHCGWNSILESIWFGVPIAAWPMYAEQQYNAFQMIVELGMAVEIKMDFRREFMIDENENVVSAEEVEKGIRCLMEIDGGKRDKLKEMREKSRKSLKKDGSSFIWLGRLIQDMIANIQS